MAFPGKVGIYPEVLEFLVMEATMPKMYLPWFQLLYNQGMVSTTPAMISTMPVSPLCGETNKTGQTKFLPMLCSLNLTHPPTKGNNELSQVWYMPLYAGTVLLLQVLYQTCTLPLAKNSIDNLFYLQSIPRQVGDLSKGIYNHRGCVCSERRAANGNWYSCWQLPRCPTYW